MKILAWMVFATMTVAFVVVFCKQQIENQAERQSAELALPTPQWFMAVATLEMEDARAIAATQPSPATPATPVIAANDPADAFK